MGLEDGRLALGFIGLFLSCASPALTRSDLALESTWAVYVDRVTQGDPMTKEDYMSSLKLVFKFRTMAEYQDKFETYRGEGAARLQHGPT